MSSRKLRRSQIETGIAPENRKRSHHHGTHQHPRPARGPQRRRRRDDPAPAPIAPVAGGGQAVAVLAASSAEPGGATVAVIAARAGINTAAARQALLAHEKNGTATRVKGSRPGIADTWTPAALEAPRDEAPPAETLGAGSSPDAGRPSAEPADGTADVGQPAPVPADGTAEGGEAEVGTAPGPDSAVTAEAAGTVAAIAQAAGEAGKALAAGNLDTAMTALETARDLAAQGRRAVKAAASGRRAPATRPGRCATWSRSTCASSPTRPSPRTRSARYSPGRPERSPTPWTSWSASVSRR